MGLYRLTHNSTLDGTRQAPTATTGWHTRDVSARAASAAPSTHWEPDGCQSS